MQPFSINHITIYSDDNQSIVDYMKQFKEYLMVHTKNLKDIKIYILSSMELNFLDEAIIYQALSKLLVKNIHFNISIISLGCISLYGALMDFSLDTYQNAILLMIEAPINNLQHMLNCIGIGNLPGQDGLVSKSGIGFCCLEKDPQYMTDSTLWVNTVEIIASKKEKFSTIRMVENFIKLINLLNEDTECKIVSFKIHTRWCDNLIRILNIYTKNAPIFDQSTWLPSFEQSNIHYHGMKPIYELLEYKNVIQSGSLVIPCLGAGGRLGILKVSKNAYSKKISQTALSKVIYNSNLSSLRQQAKFKELTIENASNFFYFMKKKYRAIDNLYFEWVI